jgi:hypothetical protein
VTARGRKLSRYAKTAVYLRKSKTVPLVILFIVMGAPGCSNQGQTSQRQNGSSRDYGYKVTYEGGSISGIKSGTALTL